MIPRTKFCCLKIICKIIQTLLTYINIFLKTCEILMQLRFYPWVFEPRKMRNRHNPLILLNAQTVVRKCLRKKVFIVKINVIRNNFFENFEKEKMLKLKIFLFLYFFYYLGHTISSKSFT
jgi:hypothetical protein